MSSSDWRKSLLFLEDFGLEISIKDGHKKRKLMPPKIKGKHFTNMDYLANAELIWLIPNLNPCKLYNINNENSYFEQSFAPCGKLGEGSFGSVIKVQSLDDGKMFAMKISKEPFKNDFDRKLRIKEVEHHQTLSGHPNIVRLHNAWEEDRFVFIQLELCKPAVLEGMAVNEETCWIILADILQALDYIHDSGKGHFDVKVENILQGNDNLYKLTDFGLMLNLGQENEVWKEGDAKYVAPELILGGVHKFTPKADIFSLGISILELAGNLELPSNGDVWAALRNKTLPFQQTKHLSDDLVEVIIKMMAHNPANRPSAKELLGMPKIQAVLEQFTERTGCDREQAYSTLESVNSLRGSTTSANTTSSADPEWSFSLSSASDELAESETVAKRQGLFSSTPLSMAEAVTDTNDNVLVRKLKIMRRERSPSLNSEEIEDSRASSPTSPQPKSPPRQIFCDWVGMTSPDRAIRNASINRNRLHCPAESLLQYGISPIRLSKSVKREYKAVKRSRVMTPRNLAASFNDENNGEMS